MAPGSPYPQADIRDIVDRTIDQRETESAIEWARGLQVVGLDQALQITLLLARDGDGRYAKAARRFLLRFIDELEPDLSYLGEIVAAFGSIERALLHEGPTEATPEVLRDLVGRLRDRRGAAR